MTTYPIRIRPLSDEDGGGWLAEVPDLPGCMSDGETPEEAVLNVQDAIQEWIAEVAEMGARCLPQGGFVARATDIRRQSFYTEVAWLKAAAGQTTAGRHCTLQGRKELSA